MKLIDTPTRYQQLIKKNNNKAETFHQNPVKVYLSGFINIGNVSFGSSYLIQLKVELIGQG